MPVVYAGACPPGVSRVSLRLLFVSCAVAAALLPVAAQQRDASDLDALMARVLARRDDNWKRMQQYVLDERETFQVLGPGGAPLYGFRREYLWFPRDGDGVFVRSPIRVDGVTLGDAERRKAEAEYLKREEARDRRRVDRERDAGTRSEGSSPTEVTGEGVRQALEPGFVSAAYFLKFKFDPGQYALAGRETLEGRPVLRIEYYPTKLFSEGRARPNRSVRRRDPDIEPKMNKAALITLWIEPTAQQILKYEFRNLPWDFLPGRAIVRVDEVTASMEMGQPFPDVWLPRSIRMATDFSTAAGELQGRFTTEYHDYRLASVSTRIR
jgi:hypothetical protein